jgi:NAD-dependent SIR2 family protein deacetylase
MFLLGAGASRDSLDRDGQPLPVYRGVNALRADTHRYEDALSNEREKQSESIYVKLVETLADGLTVGPTYDAIKELAPPGSFILTQNVDLLADQTGLTVVNLHVRENRLDADGRLTVASIVKVGEMLPSTTFGYVKELIAKREPKWVLVIGTTLEFDYLRDDLIAPAKKQGAKVVHINPDEHYDIRRWGEKPYGISKNQWQRTRVWKNERWLPMAAYEGLYEFVAVKDSLFSTSKRTQKVEWRRKLAELYESSEEESGDSSLETPESPLEVREAWRKKEWEKKSIEEKLQEERELKANGKLEDEEGASAEPYAPGFTNVERVTEFAEIERAVRLQTKLHAEFEAGLAESAAELQAGFKIDLMMAKIQSYYDSLPKKKVVTTEVVQPE